NLDGRDLGLVAILGALAPMHVERSGHRVAPRAQSEEQKSDNEVLLHPVFLWIVSHATAALKAASAAAISDTTLKLRTNDSCSARWRTGRSPGSTFFGAAASASFGTSPCSADLTSDESCRRSRR